LGEVIPWGRLLAVIEPVYPKDERGLSPVGLERMLRVHFLQQWYALTNKALDYGKAQRDFTRIDLGAVGAPEPAILFKFRCPLRSHDLCQASSAPSTPTWLHADTPADATLIAPPSYTKIRAKERDPVMHLAKRCNPLSFWLKKRTGISNWCMPSSSPPPTLRTSPRRLNSCTGRRRKSTPMPATPGRRNGRSSGGNKAMMAGPWKEARKAVENAKASVRTFVEHPFHTPKNVFRHQKVRYRGLAKNGHQLYTLLGLANLVSGVRTATA
jgi:IS5 family transposase